MLFYLKNDDPSPDTPYAEVNHAKNEVAFIYAKIDSNSHMVFFVVAAWRVHVSAKHSEKIIC